MPSIVKELMMQEMAKEFEGNPYAFISSFESLSVADMSDFRRSMEKVSTRSLVIKHSMAKKIFSKRKAGDAEQFLKGQILVTFGKNDPQNISKAIIEYAKAHEKTFSPAGVLFENKVYGQEFVKQLAKLPSRHELLTQVVVRVKSPITGLVLTLGQLMRGLVCALSEVKKQKEAQPQTA